MANTNRCNPNTPMNPVDRRHGGCRGKQGKVKEGAPPARRSARTNPSGREHVATIPKEPVRGSHFGRCTCGRLDGKPEIRTPEEGQEKEVSSRECYWK